jgi:hypothetical protein
MTPSPDPVAPAPTVTLVVVAGHLEPGSTVRVLPDGPGGRAGGRLGTPPGRPRSCGAGDYRPPNEDYLAPR